MPDYLKGFRLLSLLLLTEATAYRRITIESENNTNINRSHFVGGLELKKGRYNTGLALLRGGGIHLNLNEI